MSSFLKSIFHSSNKHKKLCEDWAINRELVVDGSTFCVRYLGSSLVEDPKSAQSTAAGVKRVIQAAKAKARRPEKVFFRVAMEGVRIDLTSTGEILMDTSIYKISYCSADSHYEQVLAFVASNEDESCECHAFLCSKRKEAQEIAVTISHAFAMAYECWKQAIEAKENGRNALTPEQMAGRGGESPPRTSKGGECSNSSRASSPEHSPGHSSPHSVSSTSGYLSSNPGSLLLELDYTDAGSDGALAPQLQDQSSGPPRCRKHWIEFGSCDELVPVGSPYGSSGHGILQLPTRVAGGEQDPPHSPSGCRNHGQGPAPQRPLRNCSFNGHYSSSRYSLSDTEQKQLLTAAH